MVFFFCFFQNSDFEILTIYFEGGKTCKYKNNFKVTFTINRKVRCYTISNKRFFFFSPELQYSLKTSTIINHCGVFFFPFFALLGLDFSIP